MATKKAKPKTPLPPSDRPRVPLGVYTNHQRESALAIKHSEHGVWYVTMQRGWVECVHAGDEKFTRDFPLVLAGYPIRRALKLYATSGLRHDEDAQKVIHRLLERL